MSTIDIHRVFHPTNIQYIVFPVAHGTFSKIEHILGHKASLNKFKKTKIAPCYHITSPQKKIRHQQQTKPQKLSKHMETEKHTAE
jgi:Asp-tRNA(Asn)/Glu-tRNA(Gln) amidotransferase C subunit